MSEDKQASSSLRALLDELQTTRDEVRVKLHLLGMDAKDQWDQLENKFQNLEKKLEEGDVAAEAVEKARELGRSAKDFVQRHVR